jgi:ATPase subunit of ABC transporter with duplicated ATPase domains
VLAVHDLEIRVGARTLMSEVSFRVSDGDKIGLVGRNGAGKTTLTKVLAGDLIPADGKVERSGELGYLRRTRGPATPRCSRAPASSTPAGSAPRAADARGVPADGGCR